MVNCCDGDSMRTCSWNISFCWFVGVSCCCDDNDSFLYCILNGLTGRVLVGRSSSSETHIDDINVLISSVFECFENSIWRTVSLFVTNFERDEFDVGVDSDDSLLVEGCSYSTCHVGPMFVVVIRTRVIIDEIVTLDCPTDHLFEIWVIRVYACIDDSDSNFFLLGESSFGNDVLVAS